MGWVYMPFFPKDTGHMYKDLVVVWLYYSLHLFSRWITALCALRPSVKSKRSSFLRVYSHDLKMQGKWKIILFLHNFVLYLLRNKSKM